MPRIAVVRGPVTDEDEAMFQKILDSASSYTEQAYRILKCLEAFLESNQGRFAVRRTPPEVQMSLFHAQALAQGHAVRTVQTTQSICKAFGMRPGNMEAAGASIARKRFASGLDRMAANAPFIREKCYPGTKELLRLCHPENDPRGPADETGRLMRAFWFMLIVTGARPDNLRNAPFDLNERGVYLYWGQRKIRAGARSCTLYPFLWTASPPTAEIWSTLQSVKVSGWGYISTVSQIAPAVIRWIERMPRITTTDAGHWTSTTPRDNLVRCLLWLVAGGVMSESRYEWLLDHKIQTARQYYQGTELAML